MSPLLRDHVDFYRQFRARFKTTGAVAPSSRFLARALTGPLRRRAASTRVLEIGPGTGAVTRRIVGALKTGDRLDLVELNENFANGLNDRFRHDRAFQPASEQTRIHVCPIEEFETNLTYDFIISGLPLNNFSPDAVGRIFEISVSLLAPDGVLSYFEYMYVRPIRKLFAALDEKRRLIELDGVMNSYLSKHRFQRDWVFINVPPAWVQHLQQRVKDGG